MGAWVLVLVPLVAAGSPGAATITSTSASSTAARDASQLALRPTNDGAGDVSAADGPRPLAVGLVSAGIAGAVLGTGVVAWWDRGFTELHFADTGLLGEETYAGGADKVGHLYAAWVSMAGMRPIYESLGISRDGAIVGASIFTFLLFNGFELIDGFTDYGVEGGDILANTVGIGLGALAEASPAFDATFGLRLGYVPSRDFLAREKTTLKFINDYSGMMYFADLKLKGLFDLLGEEPGVARYLVTGLAWGTKDYSPVKRRESRERHLGVHVGISLAEVLRAVADGDSGIEMQARFFDFYAVPFLSVLLMRELNEGSWFISFGIANRFQVGL
ncbi:YfiM family protein [Myxococcota bacterium]|nr:YfiM family protein [Myxococcota bacterium]